MNTTTLCFITDGKRHLICEPYSIENLHKMAEERDIKRCWFHGGSKPEPWVSRTKRVEIENYDEIVEELFKESAKYYDSYRSRGRIRDGVMSNSGRSSGFSHDCDKAKRISDRKNVNRIMKGDDPDNIVWYGRKDGKSKIWDWW